MKTVIKEAIGYAIVSTCGLVVDVALLWLLVQFLSWSYLGAATVSFLAGLMIAYALSVNLVFRFRRLRDRRVEFLSFAIIGAVGLLINAAVIGFAVNSLGLHYLAAKMAAAALTFAWNFISRRQLLFAAPLFI